MLGQRLLRPPLERAPDDEPRCGATRVEPRDEPELPDEELDRLGGATRVEPRDELELPDEDLDRVGGALLTRGDVSAGACRVTESRCLSRETVVRSDDLPPETGERSGPALTRDGATRVVSESLVEGGTLTRRDLLESEPTAVLLTTPRVPRGIGRPR